MDDDGRWTTDLKSLAQNVALGHGTGISAAAAAEPERPFIHSTHVRMYGCTIIIMIFLRVMSDK